MARLLSQVATIIRGSVGGITYTSNQFHQIIMRARTAPVQPNTTLQTAIRSAMTASADAWNALTGTQQTDWGFYAQATPFPGPLGPYTITGRNIMMAMKILRVYMADQLGIVPTGPDTPPSPLSGFYNLKSVAPAVFATPSATGVAITFSTETTVDAASIVEISPGFQPARKRYKGPWVTGSSQGVLTPMATAAIVNFAGLTEDAVYFIRVRAVSDGAAGRISPEFIVRAIAVTNGP